MRRERVGALVCFLLRMAGLRYGIGLPRADTVAVTRTPHFRRGSSDHGGRDRRRHDPPSDEPGREQSSGTLPKN